MVNKAVFFLCIVVAFVHSVSVFAADGPSAEGEIYPGVASDASYSTEPSLKSSEDISIAPRIELDKLDTAVLDSALAKVSPRKQIGLSRQIERLSSSDSLESELKWKQLSSGGRTTTHVIVSPGAKALRIGIAVDQLPQEIEFRFFNTSSEEKEKQTYLITGKQVNDLIGLNKAADPDNPDAHVYWSPVIAGEGLGLEIYLPPDTNPKDLRMSIPFLSHIGVSPFVSSGEALSDQGYGDSNSCQNDATCYSDWLNIRNAVAEMIFTDSGSSYICTGTLLNDKDSTTYKPYFITANHCIDSQTVASTLQTLWFFESSSCDGSTRNSNYTTRTGGALLHWTSATTTSNVDSNQDVSFLELNDTPPSGVYFSGWDTVIDEVEVTGVHHPQGDWKKLSVADQVGSYKCYMTSDSTFGCSASSGGSFLKVTWTTGGTEGGSSGSGLFHNNDQLVATLKGGSGVCTGSNSYYSKFGDAYSAGSLSQWLASTGCTYTISPTSRSFSSTGGTSSVAVTASSSRFSRKASTSLSWVNLSPTSGTGSGTVTLTVAPNFETSRSGSISIAGELFSIDQSEYGKQVFIIPALMLLLSN